jgi:hypothetical protein
LDLKTKGQPTLTHRLELGKLHYLSKDPLNAGYQWWQAARLGATCGSAEADLQQFRRARDRNLRVQNRTRARTGAVDALRLPGQRTPNGSP